MHLGDGVGHWHGQIHRAAGRHGPSTHFGRERTPLDELEYELRLPSLHAGVKHGGDVGVREAGQALSLGDQRRLLRVTHGR